MISSLVDGFRDRVAQQAYGLLADTGRFLLGKAVPSAIIDDHNPLYDSAVTWLMHQPEAKQIRQVRASIGHISPSGSDMAACTVSPATPIVFVRYRGNLLAFRFGAEAAVNKSKGDPENAVPVSLGSSSGSSAHRDILEISAIGREAGTRGIALFKDLFADMVAFRRQLAETDRTICVYGTSSSAHHFSHATNKPRREMDTLVLDHGMGHELLSDLNRFVDQRKLYRERGIPYRRTYLFYGLPGTGKTSLAVALASAIGRDIYLIPLSGMTDDGLYNLFHSVPDSAAVLIEDIDAATQPQVFKASGMTAESLAIDIKESRRFASLTVQGILNLFDGVAAPEGRVMFLTTNHIERLERRILRSGRVDRRVSFGYATDAQVAGMFERFWPDTPETFVQEFTEAVQRLPVVTAQIQEYLLLHQDSWEEAHAHRTTFHQLVDPVCEEQANLWQNTTPCPSVGQQRKDTYEDPND